LINNQELTVSKLNHYVALTIYDDATSSNNPQLRLPEWRRSALETVNNPVAEKVAIAPGGSLSVFSGSRTVLTDGTTAFSIALNPVMSSVYRVTNTAGTAPAFRTSRSLVVSGVLMTLAVNNNATLTVSVGVPTFGAVQVGDIIFIPGTATGDAALLSPFSPVNVGLWVAIGVSTTQLTLIRPTGVSFSGISEAVTPTANTQFIAYSAAGVQVGDSLEISAGFSSVTQTTFKVSSVTPSWVEFLSSTPLPLETGILPTASGMTFYTSAKRYIRIEVDQETIIKLNGDTGNSNRVTPRTAGTSDGFGWIEKWGLSWQLVITNRSTTSTLNATVITAE
jgi:hypothetical protein